MSTSTEAQWQEYVERYLGGNVAHPIIGERLMALQEDINRSVNAALFTRRDYLDRPGSITAALALARRAKAEADKANVLFEFVFHFHLDQHIEDHVREIARHAAEMAAQVRKDTRKMYFDMLATEEGL